MSILTLKMLTGNRLWFCKITPEAACDKFILAYFPCSQWEVGTGEHRPITEKGILKRLLVCIFKISISPDMLFHGLFITSNLKIYLETLTGAVFGMVQHIWPFVHLQYHAFDMSLRTFPPPFTMRAGGDTVIPVTNIHFAFLIGIFC